MAGNQVNVNLSVTDQGNTLKQRNREAKELNENLTSAARSAQRAMAPQSRMRGEGTEYGRARGTAGTTGAEARDFANQAQGLGGLVRVYATVAANLFAATAAFNALKEAANTTSMVEGLNQLGAASGVALGTLSKQFAAATDNAISLREAMGSVAKATAAGLSNQQVLEIAEYAKTASQALGVDMTDAVNRLTRGIVKLEPELLDELGLFTKIGPATEIYARNLGRATNGLTDFERRQAFANAVLQEAKDKFGALDIPANPYQKLEASIRNLATATLELVNKVLVPIIELFTNNSALLAAGVGLIAFKIAKLAVPALLQWRTSLKEAADMAKEKASAITESFGRIGAQGALKFDLNKLNKDLDAAKQASAKAQQELVDLANKQGARATKTLSSIAAGTFGQDPQDLRRTQEQINTLSKKNTQEAEEYRKALVAVKEAKTQELNVQKQITQANKENAKIERSNFEETLRTRISGQAGRESTKLDILSSVSGNLERGGWAFAMKNLEADLDKASNLSGWDKLRTRATGWAIAGASQIGLLVRAFSGLFSTLAVAGVAFAVFDSYLSTNGKQMQEFTSAVDANKSSIESNVATLTKYNTELSITALNAKGISFKQLGSDLDALQQKFTRVLEKSSNWDKGLDWFKDLVGFGVQDTFAQAAAQNIEQQLNNIPEGPIKQALDRKLQGILNVTATTQDNIKGALQRVGAENAVKLVQEATRELKPFSTQQLAVASSALEMQEALKAANIRAQELVQSLASNDPIVRFGSSLVTFGVKLEIAFQNAESSIASLKEVLKDTANMRIIDPENFKQLLAISTSYESLKKNADQYNGALNRINQEIEVFQKQEQNYVEAERARGVKLNQERAAVKANLDKLFEERRTVQVKIDVEKQGLDNLKSQMQEIAKETTIKGFQLIVQQSGLATRQALLGTQRALLQGATSPQAIAAESTIAREEIDLRKQQITITSQLNETMIANNALLQAQQAEMTIERLDVKERSKRELTAEEEASIEAARAITKEITGVLNTKNLSLNFIETLTTPGAKSLAAQLLQNREATKGQVGTLNAQQRQIEDQKTIKILRSQQELENESINSNRAINTLIQQKDSLLLDSLSYLSDEQLLVKNRLQLNQQATEQELARKQITDELFNTGMRIAMADDQRTKEGLVGEVQVLYNRLAILREQEPLAKAILEIQQQQFAIENQANKDREKFERTSRFSEQRADMAASALENEKMLFEARTKVLGLTDEQIRVEENQFKRRQINLEAQANEVKLEQSRTKELADLNTRRNKALAAADEDNFFSVVQQYSELQDATNLYYNNELEKLNRNTAAKLQAQDIQDSMTTRMMAYDDMFRKSIDNMADAMLEFTKTGKLNYKDMINSMLQDLLRFELRQQYLKAYSNIGGISGIFDMVNAVRLDVGPTGQSVANELAAGLRTMAKGGVFGAERFAKGGMFTNKIVSQPTLFKFAQGTGLMGEAGPEAIMPLKRDSSGTLGVRSTQPRVDVVVNNYTTQVAETRETVDSRGNRKIEVVIGDMVAGELGRKNSPLQQSMQQNFQAKPSVVRR